MKKFNIIYLSITFLLIACNKQYNTQSIPGVTDDYNSNNTDTICIYNISNKSAGLYSDIYSDVRYIALESGPNSMIGNIDKIQVAKNNDLIIFDKSARLVLLFDSNGRFKNTIGNVGHAENEYLEPLDVVYDEYNENVIIYDNAKKVLSYYGMNGKYVRKIQLNEYIGSFETLDKEHIILYNNYGKDSSGELIPNYVIINMKGEIVKEYAFYDERMNGMIMYPDVFCKNDILYCHIPTTSIVNKITLDSLTPAYHINFGDYQIPNEWFTQGYDNYFNKVVHQASNTAVSKHFFQTGKYTLMTFNYSNEKNASRQFLMLAKTEDLAHPRCYSLLINDMYGKQESIDVKFANKNKVYNIFDPSVIQSLDKWESNKDVSKLMAEADRIILRSLPDGQFVTQDFENRIEIKKRETTTIIISDEEKELINTLVKSNNPIIQVCTLKEK